MVSFAVGFLIGLAVQLLVLAALRWRRRRRAALDDPPFLQSDSWFAGMTIIQDPHVPPGKMYLIDEQAIVPPDVFDRLAERGTPRNPRFSARISTEPTPDDIFKPIPPKENPT
jgi:hypothetical protein